MQWRNLLTANKNPSKNTIFRLKKLGSESESDWRFRRILDGLKTEIDALRNKLPDTQVGLAIVQVGNRDDSNLYIKHKLKSAQEVGINARHIKFERDVTEAALLAEIAKLNADSRINGIIVQLPFDSATPIDSDRVVNSVSPQKVS